jgi:hypothetical protein
MTKIYRRFIKFDKASVGRGEEVVKSLRGKSGFTGLEAYSWIPTSADGHDNTTGLPQSGYCKRIIAASVVEDGYVGYTNVEGHESPNGVLYVELRELEKHRKSRGKNR